VNDIPRLHIVGKSNSGKTTLLSGLVKELTSRGYKVATIKHTGHRHSIDTQGKDTWKHRQAGSIATVMLMPNEFAVFADRPSEPELMTHLAPWFEKADLILVEGWSAAGGPCIEVRASKEADPLLPDDSPILLGYAADIPIHTKKPMFSRNNFCGIADFLVSSLLGRDR